MIYKYCQQGRIKIWSIQLIIDERLKVILL